MKLAIYSDLHLGGSGFVPPRAGADAVIVAGDVARPAEAVAWARALDRPVIYVAGNHEFYDGTIGGTFDTLTALCRGTQVHFLERSELVLGGVRFLGATLWTDFLLYRDEAARAAAVVAAAGFMRDFHVIRTREGGPLFTPADAAALHADTVAWLAEHLAVPHHGPTVVVTHHAPSPHSIHPRFAGSPMNVAFVSDLEQMLDGRAVLWVHGHTHDSFDYVVNGTRVVCNPRGYARGGRIENAAFDPELVIELP